MKNIFLLFLVSTCCYSQHATFKKGRILNSQNKLVKNTYIINSKCNIVDLSEKEGYFTYKDCLGNFELVKRESVKINKKKEMDITSVYIQKNDKYVSGKITNFLGIYPTRNVQVNGIALNLMTDFEEETSTLTNGIEIDLDPLSIMLASLCYFHLTSQNFHSEPDHYYNDYSTTKQINGINLNLISMNPMITNGVYFGASISTQNFTNGLSFSILTNTNTQINGISLSVFGNHDTYCNGLQIGLFNSSSNLKGIQLGLWNKNQKRSLPIINWNF